MGQSKRYPKIGMKQIQSLDMNAVAVRTKHFAVMTSHPQLSGSHVQIPNFALDPAVNSGCRLAAFVADWLKALVGLYTNMGGGCLAVDTLADNFDSTKGEIRCYSGYGHRRPPSDMVYLGRQTYILGDTGCPFYLKSLNSPFTYN